MSDGRYSFSLTTFSPSGELLQIKHALAAISSGATSLGIKARDGVVLATEEVTERVGGRVYGEEDRDADG